MGEDEISSWPGWETLSSAEQIFVRGNWDNPAALSEVARTMMKAKKTVEPLDVSDHSETVKISVTLRGQEHSLEIENESCVRLDDVALVKEGGQWRQAIGYSLGRDLLTAFGEWAEHHPRIFRYAALR